MLERKGTDNDKGTSARLLDDRPRKKDECKRDDEVTRYES